MRRLLIACITIIASSCQYDPFAHEYTHTRPASAATIVGTHALDRESIEMLKQNYNVTAPRSLLVLRSGGTFELREIPSCWRADVKCTSRTESATGTWDLGKDQEWWAVGLRCRTINGTARDYGIGAMLRGESPPYVLHFTVGDPDSGEGLALIRKSPAAL
jgi:hypothetical protein